MEPSCYVDSYLFGWDSSLFVSCYQGANSEDNTHSEFALVVGSPWYDTEKWNCFPVELRVHN